MITIEQMLPRYNSISIDGLLISSGSLTKNWVYGIGRVARYKKISVFHMGSNVLVFVTYKLN